MYTYSNYEYIVEVQMTERTRGQEHVLDDLRGAAISGRLSQFLRPVPSSIWLPQYNLMRPRYYDDALEAWKADAWGGMPVDQAHDTSVHIDKDDRVTLRLHLTQTACVKVPKGLMRDIAQAGWRVRTVVHCHGTPMVEHWDCFLTAGASLGDLRSTMTFSLGRAWAHEADGFMRGMDAVSTSNHSWRGISCIGACEAGLYFSGDMRKEAQDVVVG
mgnify:CR=1 FL=1